MAEQSLHVRRNIIALIGDSFAFFIGFTFFDPYVILPAFIQDLTGSTLMVGIITALHIVMFTLPQLWAAGVFAAARRKKPVLIRYLALGRGSVIAAAIATFLWAGRYPWLAVAVVTVVVALFWAAEGINGVGWPDLLGKTIPSRQRGRALAAIQIVSSIAAMGAGYLVQRILSPTALPAASRWAMLFACAFVALLASVGFMTLIWEAPGEPKGQTIGIRRTLRAMRSYLREDTRLRRMVATQLLFYTSSAAAPFLVVRAREVLASGDQIIGLLLILQNLGGLGSAFLYGYLIERFGSWLAIRAAALTLGLSLLAMTLAPFGGLPLAFYLFAAFALGIANSSWWAFSVYTLDIATEERRPVYLAAGGLLTSPSILGSLVAGALISRVPPEWVFGGALGVCLVAIGLAFTLAKAHVLTGKEPEAGPPFASPLA